MPYITNHRPRQVPRKVVKPPDHPNIVALFDNLYIVGIHRSMRRLTSELDSTGDYITGDRRIDRNAMNDIEPVPMTIDRMIEHYRDGADIYIRDSQQASTIFDICERHINHWKRYVGVGIGGDVGPMEDLILMDRFNASVFRIARHFKANQNFNYGGFADFSNLFYSPGANTSSIFVDGQQLPNSSVNEFVRPEDMIHDSNTSIFQRALLESMAGNRG